MKLITTNVKSGKLWEEKEIAAAELSCMEAVNVYPEVKKQIVHGFGGAFTESAGYCYHNLTIDKKKEFIQAYFGKDGLNYNIGRTHINSCDFSLGNYAADEDENDDKLEKFSLDREEKYIFPLIRDAENISKDGIRLLLSPWSPPAYMKTNGEMNHGGFLKEEYYSRWAAYMARFVEEMKLRGHKVSWVTVQNEPDAVQTWDSCKYSADQEGIFAGQYLGPEFKARGIDDVKIFIWDHNKECAYDRTCKSMEQAGADVYVAGVGVHWYTGDHFENLAMIRERFPELELFFTEGCVEYSRFDRSDEVYKAEMYAHDMIGNFKNGVSAFLDWNLLLDSKGGPNHVGNYCDAPVMCNGDFSDFKLNLSYYYIGHLSRYVKAGAHVIPVSAYSSDVECVAFINPDGQKILVMQNRSGKVVHVNAGERGFGAAIDIEPHSIVTLCW